MSGDAYTPKNRLASYGREIDLEAAFRDAKRLLMPGHIANPSRKGGVPGDTDDWRLARAQWHYDYGNRAMAERELKDIKPNYPFSFVRENALALHFKFGERWWDSFDAIHASPPCQAFTMAQRIHKRKHADLVGPTRDLLNATGLPWVIENVPGAPLVDYVVLEGQMFDGLRTQRKRWFEANWPLEVPFLRSPRPAPQAKMGRKPKPDEWFQVVGNTCDADGARKAMGIDWMTRDELAQAIPPAYTEFIGEQLMAHLKATVVA